jgi:uncharacterized protein (TIGR02246 family)
MARADELDAIRARAQSYQDAYNRHDAQAVADHWSDEAVYVRESGERVKGRTGIRRVFEQLFAEDPEVQLRVTITDLRLLTPDVAIEDGKAEMSSEGEPPVESTYTAVNVKRNGTWYVDSVRETDLPPPVTHFDRLKELSWMIGEWSSQDGDAKVKAKCEWAKNKNFITRQFSISANGLEISGTQVIGYDASIGKIKSWMFDSDGGVAEAVWTRNGKSWSVNTSATLPDGGKGAAVHVITYVNDNEFTWHTVSREVDGEILPNIEEVRIVRVTGQ